MAQPLSTRSSVSVYAATTYVRDGDVRCQMGEYAPEECMLELTRPRRDASSVVATRISLSLSGAEGSSPQGRQASECLPQRG